MPSKTKVAQSPSLGAIFEFSTAIQLSVGVVTLAHSLVSNLIR
jgi:hypothetical protein